LIDLAYEIGLGGVPIREMAKIRVELSGGFPLGPLQVVLGKDSDGHTSPVGAAFTMDKNRLRKFIEGIEEAD
jgi:hypothetical protein